MDGKVRWFDEKKGFGRIEREDGKNDIFVHYTAIQGSGFRTLKEGENVTFDEASGPKGIHAANVVKEITMTKAKIIK